MMIEEHYYLTVYIGRHSLCALKCCGICSDHNYYMIKVVGGPQPKLFVGVLPTPFHSDAPTQYRLTGMLLR